MLGGVKRVENFGPIGERSRKVCASSGHRRNGLLDRSLPNAMCETNPATFLGSNAPYFSARHGTKARDHGADGVMVHTRGRYARLLQTPYVSAPADMGQAAEQIVQSASRQMPLHASCFTHTIGIHHTGIETISDTTQRLANEPTIESIPRAHPASITVARDESELQVGFSELGRMQSDDAECLEEAEALDVLMSFNMRGGDGGWLWMQGRNTGDGGRSAPQQERVLVATANAPGMDPFDREKCPTPNVGTDANADESHAIGSEGRNVIVRGSDGDYRSIHSSAKQLLATVAPLQHPDDGSKIANSNANAFIHIGVQADGRNPKVSGANAPTMHPHTKAYPKPLPDLMVGSVSGRMRPDSINSSLIIPHDPKVKPQGGPVCHPQTHNRRLYPSCNQEEGGSEFPGGQSDSVISATGQEVKQPSSNNWESCYTYKSNGIIDVTLANQLTSRGGLNDLGEADAGFASSTTKAFAVTIVEQGDYATQRSQVIIHQARPKAKPVGADGEAGSTSSEIQDKPGISKTIAIAGHDAEISNKSDALNHHPAPVQETANGNREAGSSSRMSSSETEADSEHVVINTRFPAQSENSDPSSSGDVSAFRKADAQNNKVKHTSKPFENDDDRGPSEKPSGIDPRSSTEPDSSKVHGVVNTPRPTSSEDSSTGSDRSSQLVSSISSSKDADCSSDSNSCNSPISEVALVDQEPAFQLVVKPLGLSALAAMSQSEVPSWLPSVTTRKICSKPQPSSSLVASKALVQQGQGQSISRTATEAMVSSAHAMTSGTRALPKNPTAFSTDKTADVPGPPNQESFINLDARDCMKNAYQGTEMLQSSSTKQVAVRFQAKAKASKMRSCKTSARVPQGNSDVVAVSRTVMGTSPNLPVHSVQMPPSASAQTASVPSHVKAFSQSTEQPSSTSKMVSQQSAAAPRIGPDAKRMPIMSQVEVGNQVSGQSRLFSVPASQKLQHCYCSQASPSRGAGREETQTASFAAQATAQGLVDQVQRSSASATIAAGNSLPVAAGYPPSTPDCWQPDSNFEQTQRTPKIIAHDTAVQTEAGRGTQTQQPGAIAKPPFSEPLIEEAGPVPKAASRTNPNESRVMPQYPSEIFPRHDVQCWAIDRYYLYDHDHKTWREYLQEETALIWGVLKFPCKVKSLIHCQPIGMHNVEDSAVQISNAGILCLWSAVKQHGRLSLIWPKMQAETWRMLRDRQRILIQSAQECIRPFKLVIQCASDAQAASIALCITSFRDLCSHRPLSRQHTRAPQDKEFRSNFPPMSAASPVLASRQRTNRILLGALKGDMQPPPPKEIAPSHPPPFHGYTPRQDTSDTVGLLNEIQSIRMNLSDPAFMDQLRDMVEYME